MEITGGTLDFSKFGKAERLTPPDIIGVNFTTDEIQAFPELEIIRHISGPGQPLTVVCDWFEVFISLDPAQLARIPTTGKEEMNFFQWTDDIILSSHNSGSKIMAHIWDVILLDDTGDQYRFAELLTHPRNPMGPIQPQSAWLKIKNENLYRKGWISALYKFLKETGSEINNITRFDIAIDGLNDLPVFLNFYAKQRAGFNRVLFMGKSEFHPGKLHARTMNFSSFRIGNSSSEKLVTVYEKTQELERSNKQYIKDFWKVNGVIPAPADRIVSIRFSNFSPDYLTKLPIVYRCELRLKSKAVESITDFDITRLEDSDYLSSIFLTQVKSLLTFCLYTDKNVSRCKQFLPIDFETLGAQLLETSQKARKDHRFKAKMAIHEACFSIYAGKATGDQGEALIDSIDFNLKDKHLSDWFCNVLPKYEKKYLPFCKPGIDRTCINHLENLRSEIETHFSFFHETKEEREETTTADGGELEKYLDSVIEFRKLENESLAGINPEPCPF